MLPVTVREFKKFVALRTYISWQVECMNTYWEHAMRPILPTGTQCGTILAIVLVTLTVAVGSCLFDSDGAVGMGHAAPPDLCTAIALLSITIILSGLTMTGPVSLSPVRLVRVGGPRRIDPPPRPF